MDERKFEQLLREALEAYMDEQDGAWRRRPRIGSFEDAGVLTLNRGLVVEMPDGTEFQIEIVCSGRPRR